MYVVDNRHKANSVRLDSLVPGQVFSRYPTLGPFCMVLCVKHLQNYSSDRIYTADIETGVVHRYWPSMQVYFRGSRCELS